MFKDRDAEHHQKKHKMPTNLTSMKLDGVKGGPMVRKYQARRRSRMHKIGEAEMGTFNT